MEPCKRPSTFRVYGIPLCPEHGEEAALDAYEEMHQDAHDFLERFDGPHVVALPNPWVRRVAAGWRETVPADERDHGAKTDAALLAAFPFRADRANPETVCDIADRFFGNGHPVDRWRDERQDIHHLMRVAFARGMTWAVEMLEQEREHAAAQCAYAVALTRGDHPEVLETAAGAERVGDRVDKPA